MTPQFLPERRRGVPFECPREGEVVAAVLGGGFDGRTAAPSAPGRESGGPECEDLHMHLDTCEMCREIVTVAAMLRDDRDVTLAEVQVPAAGQVWWRAAIRARLEAAHAAARPITWAHGVAGACAAGLTAAVFGIAWPTIERAVMWFGERALSLHPDTLAVADLATLMMQRTLPFALGAACVLLAPLALYFALSDE